MPKYQEENYTKKEMIKIKKFIFSTIIKNKMINLKTSKTKIKLKNIMFLIQYVLRLKVGKRKPLRSLRLQIR